MSTATAAISSAAAIRSLPLGFHIKMAWVATAIILFDIVGCQLTQVHAVGLLTTIVSVLVVIAGVQALPVYWHSQGKTKLRDAALVIPWWLLYWVILPYGQDICARIGMHRPLQDANFARIDQMMGINIPSVMQWADQHWLGQLANATYYQLETVMLVAFLLPALTGKVHKAQQFIVANLVAFEVGQLAFALLPAVGPWYAYHLAPNPNFIICQADLLRLRKAGPYLHRSVGVVCFPSGHVLAAIFSAYSLWGFKWLRIPTAIISGLLILSTMTLGWHYGFDVVGGVVLAAVALMLARMICPNKESPCPDRTERGDAHGNAKQVAVRTRR